MVPLDVADVVLVEQRQHLVADVRVRLRDADVEHLLAPRRHRQLGPRGHDPLGVGAGDVGVDVDHLRLEPQPELHAERTHTVDQRAQPVGPHVLGDDPVAQAGAVVAAAAEPSVVEHEPLHAERGRAIGEVEQPRQVMVEVDGLPHVERDRPVRVDGPRARPLESVEPAGDGVEAVAVRAVEPRTGVALAGRQPDLAGQQELPAAEQARAGRDPFRVVDVVAAPRGVHGVHLAAGEPESGGAGVQHVGGVGPGAAAAVLPQVQARAEGRALRYPLLVVPPAEVEQLVRRRGDGQGDGELVDRVRLGALVGHGRAGPHQAGRQQLDLQPQPQLDVGFDGVVDDGGRTRLGEPGDGGAVEQHRLHAERRGPALPRARARQPRPPAPARRELRQHRDPDRLVGRARSRQRHPGTDQGRRLVRRHPRQCRTPVPHHRQAAVGMQDHPDAVGRQDHHRLAVTVHVRQSASAGWWRFNFRDR